MFHLYDFALDYSDCQGCVNKMLKLLKFCVIL